MDRRERYRGALLGLAAGDALGTTLEFRPPGSFTPIDDMVGGGPFHLRPGEWTDDTSMALCLAESLVECGGFDPADQMRRYVRWMRDGHLSSNGRCFDIGNTVSGALERFERTGDAYAGATHPQSTAIGSMMRLAPVPLAFARSPETAVEAAGESSRTTYALPVYVDACRYLGGLIVGALDGTCKDDLLGALYAPVPGLWADRPLEPSIAAVASGSFRGKRASEVRGTGYVVDSLEAALWAFDTGSSFREGCLLAANLGADADTTAAIYGQLAGAHFGIGGERGIPVGWIERLARRELIEDLADGLLELSEAGPAWR